MERRKQGMKRGREEWREGGKEKGRKRGRERGREEGRKPTILICMQSKTYQKSFQAHVRGKLS